MNGITGGYAHSHGSALSCWLYVDTNAGTYTVWSASLDNSGSASISGTYDLGAYRTVTRVYFYSQPFQAYTYHGVTGIISLS